MTTWTRIAALITMFSLTSCGWFERETPLERERRELGEAGEGPETLIYRALKIGLRSAPSKLNPEGPDSDAKHINALAQNILDSVGRGDGGEDHEPLTAGEYVEVAKELYALRRILRETDEDRYPTILHTFMSNDGQAAAQLGWYRSTHEHMVLALAWLAVKQVPPAFRVYETGMIDPSGIEEAPLKLSAHLIRGATFVLEGWPWMCEEEMTGYLAVLAGNQAEILAWVAVARELSEVALEDDAILLAGVHAPGVLVRGLCRIQAEKQDEAVDDLEAFLADAETLGLEGEAVWLVGAYVGLKRDDSELALTNLRKLESSELFRDSEHELIHDAIEAVEGREPGRAINALTDKLIIARLVSSYVVRELGAIDWRRQVEASDGGRKLLALTGRISSEVAAIEDKLGGQQLVDLRESTGKLRDRVGCAAN